MTDDNSIHIIELNFSKHFLQNNELLEMNSSKNSEL